MLDGSKSRWKAAGYGLLSLLLPGLGQLALGRVKKAISYWLLIQLFALILLLVSLSNVLTNQTVIILFLASVVSVSLTIFISAVRGAVTTYWREPHISRSPVFGRWYVLLGILIAQAFLPFLPSNFVREKIPTFHIPSGQMVPTLFVGDRVSMIAGFYSDSLPQRADIVVFTLPDGSEQSFIGRIIGLGGDTVELNNGIVSLNGKTISRTFVENIEFETFRGQQNADVFEECIDGRCFEVLDMGPDHRYDNMKRVKVPVGHVFIMGDNRDNSLDSRSEIRGSIPEGQLFAKVQFITFGRTWDRVGKVAR